MIRNAWNYAVLAIGAAYLTLICFAWGVATFVLWPLLPARIGRRVGRVGAMWGFRIYLTAMEAIGAWKLDLGELDRLRSEGALIIAPNHPGLLDAVLVVSRLPNAMCVMKGSLLRNFLLSPAARLARYVPNDSLRRLLTSAAEELGQGGQLVIFPEATRTSGGPIGPLTDAVGAISRHSKVPVQAVIIEASAPFLGKGWPLLSPPPLPIVYRVRLGRRFEAPQDVRAFTMELDRYFRRELAASSVREAAVQSPAPVEDPQQLRG